MAYQSLSVDTKNLHQQRRSRHGKVVVSLFVVVAVLFIFTCNFN